MSSRLFVLACGLLCSCGPFVLGDRHCYTPCGVGLMSERQGFHCGVIDEAEDSVLLAFRNVKDDRFLNACKNLSGWSLTVWEEVRRPASPDIAAKYSKFIGGQTTCLYKLMEVGNLPWRTSAYAHEMAHAIQGCTATSLEGPDPMHGNWAEDGIYDAIDAVAAMESSQ